MTENHYVDNKKLYQSIIDYKLLVKKCIEEKKEKPAIPNYVATCLLLIANRLSLKPNFVNYPYRDEMVADGVQNCICYFDNYNPEKFDNPFAYFTQIIYFAFLRRIQKEKKQLYIKHKSFENSAIMNELIEQGEEIDIEFISQPVDLDNDNKIEFIKNFEENLSKKKKKNKLGIEKFITIDDIQ